VPKVRDSSASAATPTAAVRSRWQNLRAVIGPPEYGKSQIQRVFRVECGSPSDGLPACPLPGYGRSDRGASAFAKTAQPELTP
jgi:hypothetical protein